MVALRVVRWRICQRPSGNRLSPWSVVVTTNDSVAVMLCSLAVST